MLLLNKGRYFLKGNKLSWLTRGDEGDSIKACRTTNFTNEGIIDLSNVATDGLIQPILPGNETVLIIPPEKQAVKRNTTPAAENIG
jgi:hypothetical protein